MTAHHGFTALFLGNMERAMQCADCIVALLEQQNEEGDDGIYLRQNGNGDLIRNRESHFEFVSAAASDQLYFMLGHPLWFLCAMYDELDKDTKYERYLNGALRILQLVQSARECGTNILDTNWSHGMGTGLSLLSTLVSERSMRAQCRDMSLSIANSLITDYQTDDGLFEVDPDFNEQEDLDQSAEIAMHLRLIHLHINEL